jgi:alkylation response protein AidB-like acyl-CoA dehydrogenase
MFGSIGGDEAELRFEDVKVEPWQLFGRLHQRFATAIFEVSIGRIYNSARAVGYGRWALEHAKTRGAFGKLISQYQGVSFPLAESATELHAAHLMGLNTAGLLDQGAPAVKELSMTKAYSTETGLSAVDRAMQTHGAMGFTNEIHLVEAWHSLRAVKVAGGTKRSYAGRSPNGCSRAMWRSEGAYAICMERPLKRCVKNLVLMTIW